VSRLPERCESTIEQVAGCHPHSVAAQPQVIRFRRRRERAVERKVFDSISTPSNKDMENFSRLCIAEGGEVTIIST
jgi:hypothetical protein